jgi:dihydroxy-acid dehydratase
MVGIWPPGHYNGEMLTLTLHQASICCIQGGKISKQTIGDCAFGIVLHGCLPFMGTANTMCAAAELLGFSPFGNEGTQPTEKWHMLGRQAARRWCNGAGGD